MHLTLAVDQSKQAVANPSRGARPRAEGRPHAHRPVRRVGAGRAEGGQRSHHRRASGHRRRAPRDRRRAEGRVPPVPDHRQDRRVRARDSAPRRHREAEEARRRRGRRTCAATRRRRRRIKSLFTPKADTPRRRTPPTRRRRPARFAKLVVSAQALGRPVPGLFYVAASDQPEIDSYLQNPDIQAALPPGKVIRWGADSLVANGSALIPLYVLDRNPIITGDALIDAQPQHGADRGHRRRVHAEQRRRPQVQDRDRQAREGLHGDRARRSRHGRRRSSRARSARAARSRWAARISQPAQDLALVLRAGALPVPLKVEEVRAIGASLGADSIRKGITAGVIAVALVIVIMVGVLPLRRPAGGVRRWRCTCCSRSPTLAGFSAVLTLPGWRASCCRSASPSTPTC